LDGESVMGGENGAGTWETGHGRGLGTRGIAAPCAGKGAPCEGCSGLDGPCCPSLGVPTASPGDLAASHAVPVAYAAARVASGGRVEADDQRASGDQGAVGGLEAFDAHWASDGHQAYRVALEGYRSLAASVPGASPGPSASGPDPWKASHPSAFLQDHWDPSPSVVPFDPACPLDQACPQGLACHLDLAYHLGTADPLSYFLEACLVPCLSEVHRSALRLAGASQGCHPLAFGSCLACFLLPLLHRFLRGAGYSGSASAWWLWGWLGRPGRRGASGRPCRVFQGPASLVAWNCC